jgi:hypothetical protein
MTIGVALIDRSRSNPDPEEANDIGSPIGKGMEAISGHAGRADQPAIKEFCCGYSPVENEDIDENATNFLISFFRIHLPRKHLSNPPIPPRFRVVPTFLKGGKGGLIICPLEIQWRIVIMIANQALDSEPSSE